jgi:hypothetical protein
MKVMVARILPGGRKTGRRSGLEQQASYFYPTPQKVKSAVGLEHEEFCGSLLILYSFRNASAHSELIKSIRLYEQTASRDRALARLQTGWYSVLPARELP